MREELTFKEESNPETKTIHVTFEWGWATFIMVPSLGMLTIMSDWGNASHRWTPQKSLEAFVKELLRFHPEYIMRKFAYERKDDWRELTDMEQTKKNLEERMKELHESGMITDGQKDELHEDIDGFLSEIDNYGGNADLAMVLAPPNLHEQFGHELYEYISKKPSPRYTFWQHTLIPWFQDHLRTRVL